MVLSDDSDIDDLIDGAQLHARGARVVQIVSLLLAVIPVVTPPLSSIIALLGLISLSYSFTVDILWLLRR